MGLPAFFYEKPSENKIIRPERQKPKKIHDNYTTNINDKSIFFDNYTTNINDKSIFFSFQYNSVLTH